jgi:hypothetical protein
VANSEKKKTTVSVLFFVMTNGKLWLDDKNGKGEKKKKNCILIIADLSSPWYFFFLWE